MKTKLIIVNGQGGVGKGEFVKFIKEYDQSFIGHDRILQTSIIDRVKFIASMCGWTGVKELKDRAFLHDLKILLEKYNDLPYNTITQLIKRNENTTLNDYPVYPYIFIDVREPADIERFKKDFPDCTTILVKRGESKLFGNEADDSVFNFQYDYVIDNNRSLEDLQAAAQAFWDEIIQRDMTFSQETFLMEDEVEFLEGENE